MEVFCVECGIAGDFKISGKVEFVVSRFDFETGFVEITGNLEAGLQFGLAAAFRGEIGIEQELFSREFEKRIVTVPLSPIAIPGIFVLGPKIDVDAGASLEIDAAGQILVGVVAEWPNIRAKLDIVNNDESDQSGFKPVVTPVFEVEGQISVTTTAFLKFSFGVGLDILNGRFDKSVALVDKPRVFVTAGVGASFSLEGGLEAAGGCAGIEIALGFGNDVIFDLFDREFPIFSIEGEAFSTCIE